MKMSVDQWKALAASYARSLFGAVLTAVWVVGGASHRTPFEFSADDWMLVLNAVWIAVVPPAMRWLNKNDGAFGPVEPVEE